jgi:hypothetical protein
VTVGVVPDGDRDAGAFDPAADDALAAALACAVVDRGDIGEIPRALRWTHDVWAAGVDEAPALLVHDLGYALLYGRATRFTAARAIPGLVVDDDEAAAVRAARVAYEDRVVAPWLHDPSFIAAHVVVAGAAAAWRERLVAHAIALALGRAPIVTDVVRPSVGNVARLRGALDRWNGRERVVAVDELGARATPTAVAAILAQLSGLTSTLAGRPLLAAEDLWELAHLPDLPSEAARLALRTVHAVASGIPPAAPALLARLRRREPEVAVDAAAADRFPAGGFDAMSTKGALENLVRTEVAWVGEGASPGPDGRPGPDLFDLRFVEGELLYYTRDESPLLEQRRTPVFVVEDAGVLRHKVPTLPAQTLVMVLAVALRAHHELVGAIGVNAVHTTFAVDATDPAVAAEERAILALSLRADVAHRRVVVGDAATAPVPGRVVFAAGPPPEGALVMQGARTTGPRLWVRVGGPTWVVADAHGRDDVDVTTPAGRRRVVDRVLLAAAAR